MRALGKFVLPHSLVRNQLPWLIHSYLQISCLWDENTNGNNQHLKHSHCYLCFTHHYFSQLPISCHLVICLQLRLNSISSSPRKENPGVCQDHTRQKRRSKQKRAGEKQKENRKIYGAGRNTAWNTEGRRGEGVKSMGKRNAELEQVPNLGSDALHHLSKAVAICIPVSEAGGLRASPQMASWPWCTLLLHNPDLGSHQERNKTPIKLQPIPVMRLPQICPINTAQPHMQICSLKKDGMLLQLTLLKALLHQSPGTHVNRDYYSINERKGPLNCMASCQLVLQPPAVMLKEI